MSMPAFLPRPADSRGSLRDGVHDDGDKLRRMLAAFIGYAFHFPRQVRAVRTASDLPPALERVALAAQIRRRAWLAWTDELRTWFVTGELDYSGERVHAPALQTFFHDDDGRLAASASWILDSDGRWQLWDR